MKKLVNKKSSQLHPLVLKVLLVIKKILKSFANRLQQKTSLYSPTKLKIILFLACAVFITECIIVVYDSFQRIDRNAPDIISIKPVRLLEKDDNLSPFKGKEFYPIRNFKLYLDSLKKANKPLFDSLLILRPHLVDTINYLQNLNNEQQTNAK